MKTKLTIAALVTVVLVIGAFATRPASKPAAAVNPTPQVASTSSRPVEPMGGGQPSGPTSAPMPPTGSGGAPAPKVGYTAAEVAAHGDASSCWTIIAGNVYDLTSFVGEHPGGERNILKICGKDGTAAFEGQHGGQSRPEATLAGFLIGPLRV